MEEPFFFLIFDKTALSVPRFPAQVGNRLLVDAEKHSRPAHPEYGGGIHRNRLADLLGRDSRLAARGKTSQELEGVKRVCGCRARWSDVIFKPRCFGSPPQWCW